MRRYHKWGKAVAGLVKKRQTANVPVSLTITLINPPKQKDCARCKAELRDKINALFE